ncbi:MAG: S8 family serine peptidase [Lachnospiraceae bacterium]|nr:S8 family serine peptidase [Lachnospiraceae bacterium]
MNRSKISSEAYMAINVPNDIREKSLNLNVGYNTYFDEWELIIRYTGSLDEIKDELKINIEELLGGYAIVRIPRFLIDELSMYPQIDYIEKPKSLFLSDMTGVKESCVTRVRLPDYNLTGKDTIVACLDSGVDIFHSDFQNDDNTTRIVALWDQTVPGNPPEGFRTGSLYTAEDINAAIIQNLSQDEEEGENSIYPYDGTGHGTAVLGIMAGNGRESYGDKVGMAPLADIVAVKLGNPEDKGFPRTTQLMLAVDFAIRYAVSVDKPIAINISFGNNYGAHNGNSILERYLDTVAGAYKTSIVVGTGNEGITARHASGVIMRGQDEVAEVYVGEYLTTFNIQIWKMYQDDFEVYIETPFGRRLGPINDLTEITNFQTSGNDIYAYYGEPTPYNNEQEIYISISAVKNYVSSGVWKIRLVPKQIVLGRYDMWLPVAGSTTAEVSFIRPDTFGTISIPATAQNVISVAAYDSYNDTYAAFSGRGDEIGEEYTSFKPDIAAPGVNINSTRAGGGYGVYSGTSFAAPFVTGAAALLMQYGIVDGNDRYLYGEKLRAYLIKGARPLSVQQYFPSPLLGWGALCVADSVKM